MLVTYFEKYLDYYANKISRTFQVTILLHLNSSTLASEKLNLAENFFLHIFHNEVLQKRTKIISPTYKLVIQRFSKGGS